MSFHSRLRANEDSYVLTRLVALALAVWSGWIVDAAAEFPSARSPWNSSRLSGSPEGPSKYVVERVFPQLAVRSPLYIAPEPGGRTLVLLDRSTADSNPWQIRRFTNQPAVSEAGFLFALTNRQIYGFTFHPDYTNNGFLYVFHNGPTDQPERTNRISRFTLPHAGGVRVDPGTERVVIEWRSAGHDGGDLAFGPDRMLYITSGDGTSDSDGWDSGQDLSRLLAKLLRIDVDHPSAGREYGVPANNPFIGVSGARPETWAYGFRNPWRMSIDASTGDIWVGQNGQDLWESAHLVQRSDNIGWSVMEGGHPFQPQRRRGPTAIVPPTIEHSHADFRSLTGGVVYEGSTLAELRGAYIYGDYSTGKIWGARHRNGKLVWNEELVDTALQIAAFRMDQEGRLLVVDHAGGLYQLVRRPPTSIQAPAFPTKLSDTGLFTSTARHVPAEGLLPYQVNAPGWTDGAKAERFLAIPGLAPIGYTATRAWNLTNGVAVVQTLWLGEEPTAAEARRRLETRVLLKQDGEWAGYSYRWNADQTDAFLVGKEGAEVVLGEAGGGRAASESVWRIPSRAECMTCHARAVGFVLGLNEAQMNRMVSTAAGVKNQLSVLSALGLFTGEPKTTPTERTRLVDPYDTTADLEARARSYLHANCSVCHVEAGGGNSRMQLEITQARDQMQLIGARPVHDTFGLQNAMLVAPGDPAKSVLLKRLGTRGSGQMPPLVSRQVDLRALELMQAWISSMPKPEAPSHEWTFAELVGELDRVSVKQVDPKPGRAIFERSGCVQCHRFGDAGGAVGPDLTEVGRRLDARGILESILEPSKVIAEEYATYEFERRDGEVVSGRIERETAETVFIRSTSAVSEIVALAKRDIVRRNRSAVSNMPAGMLNTLTRDQIVDLLAFLKHGDKALLR